MPTGKLLNISPDAYVPCKGVIMSDSRKDILRQITIKQFSTPEARDIQRQITNKLLKDPEYVRKQLEGMANMSEAAIEQRKNRISIALNKKYKDPVYRSKIEEKRKERRVPININGVEYSCVKEASQATDMSETTIISRIKSSSVKFKDYSRISKKEK